MNWVGGSRKRLMLKSDEKKLKEFFAKTKMQQKIKHLGQSSPNLSEGSTNRSSTSLDLATLFIVNQIAAKKEKKDPPKVSVLGSGPVVASKQRRHGPLVLPMTPGPPSELSLVESQPECSFTRKRKYVSQLSPVLESPFSDNSASDYVPYAADAPSPFSTSSRSLGPRGSFSMQMNQQKEKWSGGQPKIDSSCFEPWGCTRLEDTPIQFQPCSQPRDTPWSCPSNLSRLETPSAARVLFGSPSTPETVGRGNVNAVVSATLGSADKSPVLNFRLNRTEDEETLENDIYISFSNGGFSSVAEGSVKPKIYLKGDTQVQPSKPQVVPDTLCNGNELLPCANTSFSCQGHSCAMMDDEYSPRSFRSDSSDEKECYAELGLCDLNKPYAKNNQSSAQKRPPRRLKIREDTTSCLKMKTDNNQQTGSNLPSPPLHHSPQIQCKCWTNETREIGIQTDNLPTTETCDTAIQCSLMPETVDKLG